MPPPPHFLDPFRFGTEILYTLVIVLLCFGIYLKTRESYNLTKHKGIKYFRDAFLFFGLSYLIRVIGVFLNFSQKLIGLDISRGPMFFWMLIPVSYFSTIAILYLIYSSTWKKIGNKLLLVLSHLLALFLSIVTFLTRSPHILLYIQSGLLVFAVALAFLTTKKNKKKIQTKLFYFLISVSWLFNIWIVSTKRMFPFEIKIILQLISVIVFLIMYYKVNKWVK